MSNSSLEYCAEPFKAAFTPYLSQQYSLLNWIGGSTSEGEGADGSGAMTLSESESSLALKQKTEATPEIEPFNASKEKGISSSSFSEKISNLTTSLRGVTMVL